jgi:hypothetical protein
MNKPSAITRAPLTLGASPRVRRAQITVTARWTERLRPAQWIFRLELVDGEGWLPRRILSPAIITVKAHAPKGLSGLLRARAGGRPISCSQRSRPIPTSGLCER